MRIILITANTSVNRHHSSIVICPSCWSLSRRIGDIPDAIVFAGRTLSRPLPGGELFCCSACSLQFRWPQLTSEASDQFYNRASQSAWKSPPEEGSFSILYVGCHDGTFLGLLDRASLKFGIEVKQRAAGEARSKGVEIIGSDASVLRRIGRKFDVVTAIDVIEHSHNPQNIPRMSGFCPFFRRSVDHLNGKHCCLVLEVCAFALLLLPFFGTRLIHQP
jgi:hypothetical protein